MKNTGPVDIGRLKMLGEQLRTNGRVDVGNAVSGVASEMSNARVALNAKLAMQCHTDVIFAATRSHVAVRASMS